MFSISAASLASWSLKFTTVTGTELSPAARAARSRRSPATSWKRPPTCRTTSGCKMPCVLMLALRAESSSSSKPLRGWNGLCSITSTDTCDAPLATGGSPSAPLSRASSPRPSRDFFSIAVPSSLVEKRRVRPASAS